MKFPTLPSSYPYVFLDLSLTNYTPLVLDILHFFTMQDNRYMTPIVLQVEAENNERAYFDNIEVERKA